MPKKVSQIEGIFPIIEQYQVQVYRNQDWCKDIYYSKGNYSNNTASTCILFQGSVQDFDGRALKDFIFLSRKVESLKLDIAYFEARLENSKICYAEFHLDCAMCARARYIILSQSMASYLIM